jgi:hypothetical protein
MTTAELYARRQELQGQIETIDSELDAMAFADAGLAIGEVVGYRGQVLELYGVDRILPDVSQFRGWYITRDGVKTATPRIIYNTEEIVRHGD